MSTSVLTTPTSKSASPGSISTKKLKLNSAANKALNWGVGFWWVAAVIGQWAFAAYMMAVYNGATLTGNLQDWNKVFIIRGGWRVGDTIGNLSFAVHTMLGAILTFGGALQLVRQIRARAMSFHRWAGRVFMVTALVTSVTGIHMKWIRGWEFIISDPGYKIDAVGHTLDAVLIIIFAIFAWRTAVVHEVAAHRRWALRAYIAANGQWFLRIGVFSWILMWGGRPVGIDTETFHGPFIVFWDFASVLLPLAILEIYMRVKESRGPGRKFAMSSGLVASGLLVLLGTAGIGFALWAPIIKTVHDPRKQIGDTLAATIASTGIDQATKQYYNLKATQPANYNFEERQLDKLGYKLIKGKKFKEAIRIFQLNIETYPSSNAYDSLAEAYMRAGNKPEAILNCQKSLQINPKNGHSIEMLNQLKAP
ncbi:MAG TPA: DUF2306 domain-containing protein [Verrucomicrobiae bacterium]|nr:DUF2306 domain-containing protein [Verrucomicrobiae bacterium]